VLFATQFNKQN